MNATETPTIRALTADDVLSYRALRLEALANAPEAFGASHAEEVSRPAHAFAERISPPPPSLVLGAFAGKRLVGIAGFLIGPGEKSRHRGTLWGVYLSPELRGHGLSKRLVKAAIRHAEQHVLVLQARVVTTNLAARALYAGLGFRDYGVETKALRVGDIFHDEALIALEFET